LKVPFIVQYANFRSTDLIDQNNNFLKNINISEAKRIAREANLDLVCFKDAIGRESALCKIIDYGKWKYSEEKNKKKQHSDRKETKEIQFRPGTEDHDIEYKVKHANEFLDEGNDVLLTMMIRGRDRGHFDLAETKMNKIVQLCSHGKEMYRKKTSGSIFIRITKNGAGQINSTEPNKAVPSI
jgi:translation initiation factor IF-3